MIQCLGYAKFIFLFFFVWTNNSAGIQLEQFISMDKVIREPYLCLMALHCPTASCRLNWIRLNWTVVDWTRLYSESIIPLLHWRAELHIRATNLIGIHPQMDWNAIKHLKQSRVWQKAKILISEKFQSQTEDQFARQAEFWAVLVTRKVCVVAETNLWIRRLTLR